MQEIPGESYTPDNISIFIHLKLIMMKRALTSLILSCMLTATVQAQEVYSEVYKLSKKVADSVQLDVETRKIATFKVDALEYMAYKAAEQMPDSSMHMLDRQAYALYDFINFYLQKLSTAQKKTDKDIIIATFRNASLNNSWFFDEDKQLVLSYYNNENYMTPFSLDTNWEKANNEVHAKTW